MVYCGYVRLGLLCTGGDMAILELIVSGVLYNQLTVNRFHYVSSGDAGPVMPSFALINAFGVVPTGGAFVAGTPAAAWQNMVGDAFEWVSSYCRNLYSVSDFYELPYPTRPDGNGTGVVTSPAVAFGFYSSRVRTDIGRGYKRFAGVEEEAIGAGGQLVAPYIAASVTLADALGAVLSYGVGGASLSFTPAVLSYEAYTSPAGKRAYRPYATESEQLEHTATGVLYTPYSVVRTQRSRQYGHGA